MKGDIGTSLVNASNGRSAWAPLKEPLFRSLWTANLISNIGGWDASCRRRGSGRLVSVREGPNVRQSFDGVKIRGKAGAWNVDAWPFGPIWIALVFDNRPNHTTSIGSCGRGTDSEDKRRVS
jgi:hypothetical protein